MAAEVEFDIRLHGEEFYVVRPQFSRDCSVLGCSTSLGFVTPTEANFRHGVTLSLPYDVEIKTYKIGKDSGGGYGAVTVWPGFGEFLRLQDLDSGSITIESFIPDQGRLSIKGSFEAQVTVEGTVLRFKAVFHFKDWDSPSSPVHPADLTHWGLGSSRFF